jgi:hypothetical protein
MQLRTRRLLVVAFLLIALIAGGILLLLNQPKKIGTDDRKIDKFSHEIISDPSGKSSEQYGGLANAPVYLGFDKLLDLGITSAQLDNLKKAFYKYSISQPQPIKYIGIDVDNITSQYDQNDPNALYYIFFNVQFNQKDIYKAKAQYSSLTDIRLFLTNNSGEDIYDSQVIGQESG